MILVRLVGDHKKELTYEATMINLKPFMIVV